jgi:hypothetical protein
MINSNNIKAFVKKPSFLISLILSIFLLKGIFLADVFPIFSGQDEARHYNTVQFISEPKEKSWAIEDNGEKNRKKEKFETYNFSQEIRETAGVIGNQTMESVPYDYLSFSGGYEGKGENEINQRKWNVYNDWYPPDIVGESTAYHSLASLVEKYFSQESILVRFFLIRILSVILGLAVILLSYLIAKNIGFSEKCSLILAAIVSFQPRLSIYFTNINYDVLLIPAFVFFTFGGVLAIKKEIDWKNISIMALSVAIAILTKATGLILLASFILLIVFLVFQKFWKMEKKESKNKIIFIAGFILVAMIGFSFWNQSALSEIFNFKKINLGEYLSDSFGAGRILLTSNAYWGNLSWEDNLISNNILKLIWLIEAVSAIGIIIYLFSKKKLDFLPEKKYVVFFLFMIVALQAGIRFADFKVFAEVGSLELGAPGRYFLPNIVSHLIIVFVGLGVIFKKKEYFERSLLFGLILISSFYFYEIFNIIIPRYYL